MTIMNRHFKLGDKVYAWSNEHYGQAYLVECVVEEVSDTTLYLYSGYDNRAFYRESNDVLTYDELMDCVDRIKKDHDRYESK